MLSGLLICAECGEHMYLDRRKAKGHLYETYYCEHHHIGLRREKIEPFIREKCIELLSGEEYITTRETLLDALCASFQTETDSNTLKEEIAKIDRKIARTTNVLIDTDAPPDALVHALKDLEEEKQTLQRRLSEAEKGLDLEKIRTTSDHIRDSILSVLKNEDSTADDLRNAVSVFVAGIEVATSHEKNSKVACVTIKHGIPGYIISPEVADNSSQKLLRPSKRWAKALNNLRTVSAVYLL